VSEREPERLLPEPQRLLPDPQRLAHDRGLGELLSNANAAYRAGLDEARAFQRLSQQLEASDSRWRWQGLTLGAALCAAAGAVLVLGVFDEAPSRVEVGPEVSAGRRLPRDRRDALAQGAEVAARASTPDAAQIAERLAAESVPPAEAASRANAAPASERPSDVRSAAPPAHERQVAQSEAASRIESSPPSGEAHPQRAAAPQLAARPKRPQASDRAQRDGEHLGARRSDSIAEDDPARDGVARAEGERAAEAAPPIAAHPEVPSSAARTVEARLDCSDLLEKDARAAEHCYSQRAAQSSGLSAEAALYELARLRRDVQQDAKGALAALNEYRDRFPHGSLRNEVGLSRVELLSELSRSREALNEAEALLGSAKGGERAAELYLLRGDIFRRDLADFAQAALEYAKAEKLGGGFGAEATRLRGLSLEALGDVEGALAAYRRYLSGPDQPRKGEVNRRIEALTSSQRGATP
jgi:hypothetical protein